MRLMKNLGTQYLEDLLEKAKSLTPAEVSGLHDDFVKKIEKAPGYLYTEDVSSFFASLH